VLDPRHCVVTDLSTNDNNATGMVAASTGKRGPSKKKTVTSSKSKNKNKNKNQVIVNVSQPEPSPKESVAAVKNTVGEILNPTQASLIPRAPRQPLSPGFYPGSLNLKADDSTQTFSGVIVMNPDLDQFIVVKTQNGGSISASAAQLVAKYTDMPGIQLQNGHFYSVPAFVKNNVGSVLQSTELALVDETVAQQYHYLSNDGRIWHTGGVWVVNGQLSTISANAVLNPVSLHRKGMSGVEIAGTIRSGAILPDSGIWNSPTDTTLVIGTTSYNLPDYTLGTGNFALALQATSDTEEEYVFYFGEANVDLTLNTTTETVLPIGPAGSSVYQAIRSRASQFSITRFFGNLAWRGSHAYDAGNVGGALVPHNLGIPTADADLCLDLIGRLPYRKTMNEPAEGVHVAYLPQRIQDLFLMERGSEIHGNKIVIAFSIPPTGSAGQSAAFLFSWAACVEWLLDDPSVPQLIPPWGEGCYYEVISALGDLNPASGNPEHLKKIKEAMQRVAGHPAVKTAADIAWRVTKAGAKAALPMLLAAL